MNLERFSFSQNLLDEVSQSDEPRHVGLSTRQQQTQPRGSRGLVVVVDTCVLIANLAVVDQIRANCQIVFIPWTVVQELDGIKD